ncbi:Uncharacterised protein [Chryseobacterium nakagawai]|uniref:Uncharacterized protein n=1 Tax=Chryseobacterium nakagawai TaxID=1241982 RepID=A0AAD1DP80_CHRNA|nr:hypothetical protein [Chryseobacterium nakagawai]AZA89135.1 hypothetical protein EG343_00055 [Chryseobacterium nakagawai]VEH20456.1 Uncharacterised protein [Chryseobacterium nakagawai]
MGQDITCLITDQPLELDKDIVHFKIRDVLFVPFDIMGSSISWLIEDAYQYETAQDLFSYFKQYQPDDLISWDMDEKHTVLDIIKLIEDHDIRNFIIEHTADFASMPMDDYFLAILDGKIIKDSIVFDENDFSKKNYANIEKYREKIGLNFNWIGMDKFHAYSFAEKEYFR